MKQVDNSTLGVDLYGAVRCDCGQEVKLNEDYVVRCSVCGKGYRPQLAVCQYEKDEKDPYYSEWADLVKRVAEHNAVIQAAGGFDAYLKKALANET